MLGHHALPPTRTRTRLGAGPFFEDPDPDPDPKKKIVRTRTRPGPGVLLPRLATLRSEVKIERNDEAYTKAFILRFILIVLNSKKIIIRYMGCFKTYFCDTIMTKILAHAILLIEH